MLDITIPILKKNRAKKYQVSNILDGCDQIKNFEFIYQIKIGQAIKIVKFEALKVRRFRLVNAEGLIEHKSLNGQNYKIFY